MEVTCCLNIALPPVLYDSTIRKKPGIMYVFNVGACHGTM